MARNAKLEDRIMNYAARCVRVCEALPVRRIGSASFSDQLFRSSTSVAANYSEATQSESRKDFIHKLKITLKELNESRTWLRIIGAAQYLKEESLTTLVQESDELIRILSASVITAKRGLQSQ